MAKSTQELMVEAAQYLNGLDKIEPNNKEIWHNYLHKWDNKIWTKIFTILLELSNDNPKLLKEYQKDQLIKARTEFISSTSKSNRIMDTKPMKKHAWGTLMLIKDVFNAVHEEQNRRDPVIKDVYYPQHNKTVDAGTMTLRPPKKKETPKDYDELGHEHIAWHQPKVTTEVYPDRTIITIYHNESDEDVKVGGTC